MDCQNRIGFYALQAEAFEPKVRSMGELPATSVSRVRMAHSFHQPVATCNYQTSDVSANVITETNSQPLAVRTSWMSELYNRPMDRREFIAATAGLGVMALGVRAILESKLNPRLAPAPPSSARGFGAGPYGA